MNTGPRLLIHIALLLVLAGIAFGTPADADLWGHLTFGRDILATGHVGGVDPYSFTSDREWINHEWLAEAIFYKVLEAGGAPGLIAFKVAMIALLSGLVWFHARRVGAPARIATVLAALTMVGTYWRMHNVRPQLFSVVFFAVLLFVMSDADRGRRRGLWIVPILFALWVNLHGGWLVGAGVLAVWVAFGIFDKAATAHRRLALAGLGAAALAGTLANPHGAAMWMFLAETVRMTRPDIDDWGSILQYPLLLGIPWLLTLRVGVVALWRSRTTVRWSYAAIVLMLAVASARLSRLDAFFAVAVVMLLAEYAVLVWPRASGSSERQAEVTGAAGNRGRLVVTAVATAAMLVPAVKIIGPYTTCLPIVGQPEVEATRFVQRNRLQGRLVTHYNWGQYVIWQFAPALKVSMDGRRETVYSDDMIWSHWRFYDGTGDAEAFLRRMTPDYIWLPRGLPVVDRLKTLGWMPVFDGPVSVIFAPAGSGPFQPPLPNDALLAGPRCFPGP